MCKPWFCLWAGHVVSDVLDLYAVSLSPYSVHQRKSQGQPGFKVRGVDSQWEGWPSQTAEDTWDGNGTAVASFENRLPGCNSENVPLLANR